MPRAHVPLSGSIERHSVPAVLRALLAARRDGCLTVTRGEITRRLYLRGGMLVYGSSTERQDRLGEILIAQGRLSKVDHKKYWGIARAEGRRLGQTLVVNGRITPTDLYQGVTAQVVTILERLLKWRKGEYAFEEGSPPEPGTALLCIPLALFLRAEPERARAKAPAKAPKGRGRKAGRAAAAKAADPAPAVAAAPEVADPAAAGEEEIAISASGEEAIRVPSPEETEEAHRIGEISFLAQEVRARRGQNPRAILGVAPDSPRDAVQLAFHRLAEVLHPDRIPRTASPVLAREAGEALRAVTAAVAAIEAEVPGSPAGEPHPAAPRSVPPEEQARRLFGQGREFVVRGNYWQAADALRQAVRLRPEEPVFRQYLALALMQMKRHQEAEEHLSEAIRLEPANAAHWVNLGRIYRSGRLVSKARQAFERALRLEPRNEHAREELRELAEDPPAPRRGGPSLFKKLFGKG